MSTYRAYRLDKKKHFKSGCWIDASSDQEAKRIFLDRDSLQKTPGHVLVRLESTFPGPQALNRGGVIFNYVKTIDRVDVDCRARVYTNVSRDLYGDDGLRQISLNEQDSPIVVVEGTVQAALIKAFCS
jgi:hypothetical protein